MSLLQGFNHVATITPNLDRLIAFYEEMFDVKAVLDKLGCPAVEATWRWWFLAPTPWVKDGEGAAGHVRTQPGLRDPLIHTL